MWSHSGKKCCHRALSSASLCLIPAHHVPPVVFPSLCLLLCVHIGVNHCRFFLRCRCPALRIHNHTVLPSSHNSSYVYTNDSAYTNISATVGEDQSLSAHWNVFVHHPLLSVVLSVSPHGWAECFTLFSLLFWQHDKRNSQPFLALVTPESEHISTLTLLVSVFVFF